MNFVSVESSALRIKFVFFFGLCNLMSFDFFTSKRSDSAEGTISLYAGFIVTCVDIKLEDEISTPSSKNQPKF